jgi:hypothetical protein
MLGGQETRENPDTGKIMKYRRNRDFGTGFSGKK